jgi:hypothetical protein
MAPDSADNVALAGIRVVGVHCRPLWRDTTAISPTGPATAPATTVWASLERHDRDPERDSLAFRNGLLPVAG